MTNVAKLPAAEGQTFLDYPIHELANVFEMIKGKEFEELCIDIKANGIHTPIVLYDDGSGPKILDGRNRYSAAKAVGHRFTSANFKTFGGDLDAAETFVNKYLLAKTPRQLLIQKVNEVDDWAWLKSMKPHAEPRRYAGITRKLTEEEQESRR